jgi:hypothetical protein
MASGIIASTAAAPGGPAPRPHPVCRSFQQAQPVRTADWALETRIGAPRSALPPGEALARVRVEGDERLARAFVLARAVMAKEA